MRTALRVAARFRERLPDTSGPHRYLVAYEFSSPEEREKYLKDHPGADPSRHTVKEQGKKPGKPEEQPGKPKPGKPEPEKGEKPKPEEETPGKEEKKPEKKPGILKRLKGVSDKALSALRKAPENVQQFFMDENVRRKTLLTLHKAVGEAPKKYGKKLIDTAKHEVHEYKEAAGAVRDALKGKKLNDHQKKAVKSVAIHMGITLTAAALTTTGVMAGAGFTVKAMAKHIALKAAANALGHLHVAQELGHIGHGVADIMTKLAAENEQDPDKILAALVMKSVQEELENLDDETLAKILNEMGEGETREAALTVEALPALLSQAETVLKGLRGWIRSFPQVHRRALAGAVGLEGTGLVWQDPYVAFWKDLDNPLEALASVDSQIDEIYYNSDRLLVQKAVGAAKEATSEALMPRKARIEYAIGNPQFHDHPDRKSHIAYEVDRVATWAQEFEKWIDKALGALRDSSRIIRRAV